MCCMGILENLAGYKCVWWDFKPCSIYLSILDCKPSANLVNTHMFALLVIDLDDFCNDDSDKNILTIALLVQATS